MATRSFDNYLQSMTLGIWRCKFLWLFEVAVQYLLKVSRNFTVVLKLELQC